MPSPSQRITKATDKSIQAYRLMLAAEKEIARAFIEMVRADASESALPPKIPTPPKTQPQKK